MGSTAIAAPRADRRALNDFLSNAAGDDVRRMVLEDPALVGTTQRVEVLASDDVDMLAKGRINRGAAEADLANLRAQLQSETLTQQAAAFTVEADYNQAKLQSEADTELNKQGLVSNLTQRLSSLRADQRAASSVGSSCAAPRRAAIAPAASQHATHARIRARSGSVQASANTPA